ncbi:MAG TPA: PASTA domain-containing protein [Terrimicrobiaceae bacterium]
MANRIFAITVAHETVTLDDQGRAQVSFTVSNTGPKSLAGRAKLIALGSTKEAWLTLDGEPERTFAKGESHQFTIKIATPPGTPTGKYAFRLNIISVENPDDDFTEGPSVSFEVRELAPVAPPPRKFPWWIVAVAGLVVVGAAIIAWLLVPAKMTVPNVVGHPVDEARELLKDFAYTEADHQSTGKSEPGVVIAQDPAKGARLAKGSKVAVTIEADSVKVPKLLGLSASQADETFKDSRLELKKEIRAAGGRPGTIVDQQPKAEERVAPGTVVTAFVEPEPQMVEVPDVIGVPADKVGPMFEGRKLQYYVIGLPIMTGKVPVGTIAHQSPGALQRVRVGTRVELAAEAESVVVPDVRGKLIGGDGKEQTAADKLRESNLREDLDARGIPLLTRGSRVASQSPEPGTLVAPHSRVTLYPEK